MDGEQAHTVTVEPSNMYTLGSLKFVLIGEVTSFQGAKNAYLDEVGTWSSVLIRKCPHFRS